MVVKFIVLFTLTKILLCEFSISTPVSDEDGNSDQFTISGIGSLFGFGQQSSTLEEENSFTDSLGRTLSTTKNLALNLYYGENQQIRGNKKKCGWVKQIICFCFGCCNVDEDEQKIVNDSFPHSKINADLTADHSANGNAAGVSEKSFTNYNEVTDKEVQIHGEESHKFDREYSASESNQNHLVLPAQIDRQNTIIPLIDSVREWIEEQAHQLNYFPSSMDNHFIERFLIVCEKNIERTKLFIQSFFQLRFENSEFFTKRDPLAENLQQIMDVVYILPLQQRTEMGYQVGITHIANTDASKLKFMDYAKMYFNISDVRMKIEKEIPTGDIAIFDMEGFSIGHTWSLGKSYFKISKYSKITEDAHPIAVKKIHLINMDSTLQKVMNFGLGFVQQKTKDKIVTHTKGSKTLFDHIPREIIPKDVGGTGPSFQELREFWKERVQEHRDWLINNSWLNDIPKKKP